MFKHKDDHGFLDIDAGLKGDLVFSDPVNLRINGHFQGSIKAKGRLIINKQAQVEADIVGEDIFISGKVKGNIKASKKISLTATAQVYADIEAPIISIQEGAFFLGNSKMGSPKMTIEQLANYLSIEEEQIKDWVKRGKIPVEKIGDDLAFDPQAVDIWIKTNV